MDYSKLFRFPLGTIRAEGFLKEQLERGKAGMAGNLPFLEPDMIANPYINKNPVGSWTLEEQSGWGAEISGNYWTGYIQHAYTLGDEEMIKRATEWVDAMIKKQRSDGYLGTYYEPDAEIYDDFNAWGTTCAMRGLIAFYEATGRRDILDAVHRCMLWFVENWSGDHKTVYAGGYIIEPMVFCYLYTGDERLVKYAEEYAEYMCSHDIFSSSYKAYLEEELRYNSNHTVAVGMTLRLPALLYRVTGKEKYLRATERAISQVRKKCTHLSGSPVSVCEYLGPVGSTTETEYCSYTFFNASYSYMSEITGESKYGDYMEEMFYNGAQGARKKDERAIAYLSAPNQIYATDNSSPAMKDMQVYSPCYPVSCCPVNSVVVVPEFIRGMLLHDREGNIYATAYGPCSMKWGGINLTEKTLYPFRNTVEFDIDTEKSFTLCLKVPDWAESATVYKNGECEKVSAGENGYIPVFVCGKTNITVDFTASVKVIRVDDSDAGAKYPIAIKYGTLLFSYHIPEKWEAIKGTPTTPLPSGWSWFNVKPVWKEAQVSDIHERVGLRKFQTSWNIALDENMTGEDVTVELVEGDGYVWSEPRVLLHTHCYKAPYLCAPYPHRTLEPFGQKQYVTEKLPLTLEPYGCTNLRITYFPRADIKKQEDK